MAEQMVMIVYAQVWEHNSSNRLAMDQQDKYLLYWMDDQ